MKQTYEMPQVEMLELELEGLIAESGFWGNDEPELPSLDLLG